MAHGGARPGAGRRKQKAENSDPESNPRKNLATEILAHLKDGWPNHEKNCTCERCLWRDDAIQRSAEGRAAREYLWNRADGKPVHNINHMHDKPIEMNVNVTMSEIVRKVRQRKLDYERSLK